MVELLVPREVQPDDELASIDRICRRLRDRAEIFGSFIVDTRIDRDVRPLFVNDASFGGVLDRYPNVNSGWTGDHIGDFYLGAKVNLWSEARQNPAAIAIRGIVKLPTAD